MLPLLWEAGNQSSKYLEHCWWLRKRAKPLESLTCANEMLQLRKTTHQPCSHLTSQKESQDQEIPLCSRGAGDKYLTNCVNDCNGLYFPYQKIQPRRARTLSHLLLLWLLLLSFTVASSMPGNGPRTEQELQKYLLNKCITSILLAFLVYLGVKYLPLFEYPM